MSATASGGDEASDEHFTRVLPTIGEDNIFINTIRK